MDFGEYYRDLFSIRPMTFYNSFLHAFIFTLVSVYDVESMNF